MPYPGDHASTECLVLYYCSQTYTASEILGFLLLVHNICLSRRSLCRIKKSLNIRRNNAESPVIVIVEKLIFLHNNGYRHVGYRSMWKLLNNTFGIRVTQKTVRTIMRLIDPEGMQMRRGRRLVRRQYQSNGPGYCVHIDGYDKLKPFGFSIHGCIDGYSRKILWLSVDASNKNPRVVAWNFIDYLRKTKRLPRVIRTDAGTENVLIHKIQVALRFFHGDSMAGHKSISIGRSTANQRIEMLWSFLMRYMTQFWRTFFSKMIDDGDFNNADPIHIECARFCFFPLIKNHLQTFMEMWNSHRIRPQRQENEDYGVPNVMFYQPLLFGKTDCSFPLPCQLDVLDVLADHHTNPPLVRGSSEPFRNLVSALTQVPIEDFDVVNTPLEAKQIFCALQPMISQYYMNN